MDIYMRVVVKSCIYFGDFYFYPFLRCREPFY